MQKKLILTIIMLFAFSTNAFATEKTPALKFEEYKGRAVPDDIPVFDESGGKHYLEEYEGKTLLIVFWATWCSPCAQEMLDLDILQKDFRKLPFAILPIAEDHQGIKVVEAFYKSNEIRHLPLLHDYRNALFNAFEVAGMPTSFLITEDGMNVAVFKGIVNWHDDNVRAMLLSHIPGNPVEPKNSYKTRSLNQVVQKPALPSDAKLNADPKADESMNDGAKAPESSELSPQKVQPEPPAPSELIVQPKPAAAESPKNKQAIKEGKKDE